ncbi:MAG: 4-deoxy-4-formamido-L-arabinose-phosphoundecaprenol deformylase [Gammaproteobacteria bacterium]|nr:4-deoxy-4-formamido-L-arabinose-phosphoundecaprenol deformylase [Gammaproteobacteria bacterium]NNJ50043.1 4-deoxy-4-formamido-L-arabinose-phosphoundecaprenol deformylase [Gammaproteobacteria bacterium]
MIVGLRVDVDTFRGTRDGVPGLLKILNRHDLHGTFFFSVGPDNMGRHLWRLLKPAFLLKMLRSRAASLYGWDILLRGTFWPGPDIAKKLAPIIRDTEAAGHEVGLHSWDHHRWQMHMQRMSAGQIEQDIRLGVDSLERILESSPRCSAVAGWKANQQVVVEKSKFGFVYNSDCRGESIFRPVIDGVEYAPQIPATLPTYDEVIGQNGITADNYNEHMLGLIVPDRLNVLTIHAEVEGIVCAEMFDKFLAAAKARNIRFVPMSELLPDDLSTLPIDSVTTAPLPGREGWVCWQASQLT